MSRTDNEVEELERKLNKRGFFKHPRPVICDKCGEFALFSYELKHTNIGGRAIKWCHACGVERAWRRPGGGDLVEDASFDLEQFLA